MSDKADSVSKALQEIEQLAGDTARPKAGSRARKPRSRWPAGRKRKLRPSRIILMLVVLAVLPFWVLVLGSTSLVRISTMGPWAALATSGVVTALLIGIYFVLLGRRLGLRAGSWGPKLGLAVVGAYCVYGLLFISPRQFKSPEIKETYTALHPVIRLALATMVLVDSGAVITDAARAPEDYAAMGLPVNQRSLHFPQEDGFVHAVDLRTVGRPEWLNTATTVYLRSAGLTVLRHTGTADHLHVYLPLR